MTEDPNDRDRPDIEEQSAHQTDSGPAQTPGGASTSDGPVERPSVIELEEVAVYGGDAPALGGEVPEDPYEVAASVQVPDNETALSDLVQRLRTATVEHVQAECDGEIPYRRTPGSLAKEGDRESFRRALNRLLKLATEAGLDLEAADMETRQFAHRVRLTEEQTGPSAATGDDPVIGRGGDAATDGGGEHGTHRYVPPEKRGEAAEPDDPFPGKWSAQDDTDGGDGQSEPPAFRSLNTDGGERDEGRGDGESLPGPSLPDVPVESVPEVGVVGLNATARARTVKPVDILRRDEPGLVVAICTVVADTYDLPGGWFKAAVSEWADGAVARRIVDDSSVVDDAETVTDALHHTAGLCKTVVDPEAESRVYYYGPGTPPAGIPSGDPTDTTNDRGDDE
jgi:hypothetical protein